MFLPSDIEWSELHQIVDAKGVATATPEWLNRALAVSR